MSKFVSHLKPSFFHFTLNRELDEMLISIALRFLSLGMIGIFLPIYLLFELGVSLAGVSTFFIILSASFIVFSFLSAKIASKIGFKHVILLSVPITILFFFLLSYIHSHIVPLYAIALIGSFGASLYWVGHHNDLAKFTVKKSRGEEVGLAYFVNSISILLGPLLGGIILTYYDFNTLFLVGSLILLVSATPLFFSKDFYLKSSFSIKKVFKVGSFKDALAFFGEGVEIGANHVIWPLFLFSILGAYFSLGLVGTIAGLIMAISSMVVGKLSDKKGSRFMIKIGAVLLLFFWIGKIFVKNNFHVYLITIFVFVRSLSLVPFDTLLYSKAKKSKHIVEYILFREVFANLGRLVVYIILLISSSYVASFIFTGIAQFLIILF